MLRLHTLAALAAVLFTTTAASAQLSNEEQLTLEQSLIGDWDFTPIYTLGGNARNAPGLNDRLAEPIPPMFQPRPAEAPVWFGMTATDQRDDLLGYEQLPKGAFTIEAWMLHHVNQPIGLWVGAGRFDGAESQGWYIGMNDREAHFGLGDGEGLSSLSAPGQRGFHNWLYHLVGVYDGETMKLYLNGELIDEVDGVSFEYPDDASLDAFAYMENEPLMTLGELLRHLRVYSDALSAEAVQHRFDIVSQAALEGRFLRDELHYTAGPVLQMAQQDRITLLWETDRPATAVVEYGDKLPFEHKVEIDNESRLHEYTITGLESGSPYFYQVTSIAGDERIESGALTFKTAVGPDDAFAFAVIGDTEARPHINDRLSKLMWGERPDFVIVAGDLTDGGHAPNRYEWVYEYLLSTRQTFSRVPSFPVIGNGESDGVWYTHYHALPEPERYYTFTYGNAQFFMLDSNRDLSASTEQYQWLEEQLKNSDTTWRIAVHHHPTYSSDENDYGDSWSGPSHRGDPNVQNLLPLYENYGVDVVWFGHLHTYERSWPVKAGQVDHNHGVIHIQTGGAGGNLEDMTPNRSWFTNQFFRGHHYCVVRIHKGVLEMKMADIEGRVRDQFKLVKDLDE